MYSNHYYQNILPFFRLVVAGSGRLEVSPTDWWEVGGRPQNRWEVGLLGGRLSKMAGDGRLAPASRLAK